MSQPQLLLLVVVLVFFVRFFLQEPGVRTVKVYILSNPEFEYDKVVSDSNRFHVSFCIDASCIHDVATVYHQRFR